MKSKKQSSTFKSVKYLPVVIILLALTIIVSSTLAYFTDRVQDDSILTFSKVELSAGTTLGVDGILNDVIPGSKLVDGAVSFSKEIDSEAIYVRAKVSFSIPAENKDDETLKWLVNELRSATQFNIQGNQPNNAKWSAKDGNYFYLLDANNETKLMRVDTIDTYVLSSEMIVPRDLENLPDNVQYMKSVNFHIAFEAIQANNVSNVLAETKETFNEVFPARANEIYVVEEEDEGQPTNATVNIVDETGAVEQTIQVEVGKPLSSIEYTPADSNTVMLGWYKDNTYASRYSNTIIVEIDMDIYPKLETASNLNDFIIYEGVVLRYNGTNTKVVIPSNYSIESMTKTEVTFNSYNEFENYMLVNDILLSDGSFIDVDGVLYDGMSSGLEMEELTYPLSGYVIKDIVYKAGNDYKITEIGVSAFDTNTVVEEVVIPENITKLGNLAFYQCENLRTVHLPSTLEVIPYYAFADCTNLTTVELPESLEDVGERGFYRCSKLEFNELPETLITLGENAFANCDALSLVVLGGNIQTANYAFSYCSILEYILCETQAVADLIKVDDTISQSNIYVRQESCTVTFVDEIIDGLTIGVGSDGTYNYVRLGTSGDYTYYKTIATV